MNTVKDALVFTALGAVLTGVGAAGARDSIRVWTWRWVKGTVSESHIETIYTGSAGSGDGQRRRFLAMHYTYTVGDTSYTSSRWSFGSLGPRIWSEAKSLREYAKGTPIKVYYDPAHPESSVIRRSLMLSSYVFLGFGLLCLFGGLRILLWHAWRWVTKTAV